MAEDDHTDFRYEPVCLLIVRPFATAQVVVSDLAMEEELGVGERTLEDPLAAYEELPVIVLTADMVSRPIGVLNVEGFGRELSDGPHSRRRPRSFVLHPERIEDAF